MLHGDPDTELQAARTPVNGYAGLETTCHLDSDIMATPHNSTCFARQGSETVESDQQAYAQALPGSIL